MTCSSGDLLHVAGEDKVQLYILCGSLTVECQLSSTQAGMYTQQQEYKEISLA